MSLVLHHSYIWQIANFYFALIPIVTLFGLIAAAQFEKVNRISSQLSKPIKRAALLLQHSFSR